MTRDPMTSPTPTAAARALLAQATPGPWRQCGASDGQCACGLVWSTTADTPVVQAHDGEKGQPCNANTALIAAAPTLLAHLCDQLDAAREEQQRQRVQLDFVREARDTAIAEAARLRELLGEACRIAHDRTNVLGSGEFRRINEIREAGGIK